MTGPEIEKLIEEARAIFLIPWIGKSLEHKILELKARISSDIDSFQTGNEAEAEEKPYSLDGTRFEITRVQESLWIPFLPGNKCDDIYRVIPQVVVDYIVDNVGDSGVIDMQKGLKFPRLKGRIFDLSFEKQNDYRITGIIREVKKKALDEISPDNQAGTIEMFALTNKPKKVDVIKLLAFYLANFDTFYNHVASEFFLHWKPLIDGQLLEKISAK